MSLTPHVLLAEVLEHRTAGDLVSTPAETLHHLQRVLRLADGAEMTVTDGAGRAAAGRLEGAAVRLTGAVHEAPARSPQLVLAQALAKGRRTEDAVRAACELGVDRLVPVVAARTQGRPDARAATATVARWEAVAASALEQSRGTWRAQVDAPVTTAVLAHRDADAVRLVAVPGAPPLPDVVHTLRAAPVGAERRPPERVVVAVGPEGGWAPEELAALADAGWRTVGLGPSVLRTEHAGSVAVAVLAALLGRWGSAATLPIPSGEETRPPVSGPL